MFNQYHRQIKEVRANIRKYYYNSTDFQKSIEVRRILEQFSFFPKLISINKTEKSIDEEKINGPILTKNLLNEANVIELAQDLKILHSAKFSKKLIKLLTDDFTKDQRYHPLIIYNVLFENLPKVKKTKYLKYKKIAVRLEKLFSKQMYFLSIVHGDLRPENTLVENKKTIKLIDWDDSRIDLPIVDIYNFFHNFQLNNKLKELFWETYPKPKYWTKELEIFLETLNEMYNLANEPITIIIPTYNRCPSKNLTTNPLYTTFSSLLDSQSRFPLTVIIGDDSSTDFTYQTVELLKQNYGLINIRYFKNKKRYKASYTRQKAIKLCETQLFLMTDDDCIFPDNFINNTYVLFKKIRLLNRNIAVLNLPYVNKRFEFNGYAPLSQFGKADIKHHWLFHNFDKLPERVLDNYIEVDTFEGIFLGVKECIQSVGGFEDLRDFIVDYAEHISLSWRLTKAGFSIYHALGLKFLVTHLKFGDYDPNINYEDVPKKYRSIIKRANKVHINSGDRVNRLKTLESFISSFVYFYFCVSISEGKRHIKKEYEYLVRNKNLNQDTLSAYKKGVHSALKILYKKKIIPEQEEYIDYLKQICEPNKSNYNSSSNSSSL